MNCTGVWYAARGAAENVWRSKFPPLNYAYCVDAPSTRASILTGEVSRVHPELYRLECNATPIGKCWETGNVNNLKTNLNEERTAAQ